MRGPRILPLVGRTAGKNLSARTSIYRQRCYNHGQGCRTRRRPFAAVPAEPEAAEPEAEEFSSAPAIVPSTELKREGLAPEIWVVGLIGVIVILLLLFGLVL